MLNLQNAQLLALLLAAIWCVSVTSSVPDVESDYMTSLQYRDDTAAAADEDSDENSDDKPIREDGLGSLLLKNLRFRDVNRLSRQLQPLQWMLKTPRLNAGSFSGSVFRNGNNGLSKVQTKRNDVSVSQLAKLLNTLKTRNTDGNGVKLQSLRFGK